MSANLAINRHVSLAIRHDWQLDEVQALYALPFNDLIFKAQTIHREHFDPNEVQISSLLILKPVHVRKIAAIAHKVRVMIPA